MTMNRPIKFGLVVLLITSLTFLFLKKENISNKQPAVIEDINLPKPVSDTMKMHLYDLGDVLISDEPLPLKVYESQKYKIVIITRLKTKNIFGVIHESGGFGTGKIIRPGVILSARHVINQEIREDVKRGRPFSIESNGLLTSPNTSLEVSGILINEDSQVFFPLKPLKAGQVDTLMDLVALEIPNDIIKLAKKGWLNEKITGNPFKPLLHTTEFSPDALVGDTVWVSGIRMTQFSELKYNNLNKNKLEAREGFLTNIYYNFKGVITKRIENTEFNNEWGVKLIYEIRVNSEFGFSGGDVLDDQGRMVGTTILTTEKNNFIWAISSKDSKLFLKNIR